MPDVIRTLSANWTTRPRTPRVAGAAEGGESVSDIERDDDGREVCLGWTMSEASPWSPTSMSTDRAEERGC